jgi:hypothetical protein
MIRSKIWTNVLDVGLASTRTMTFTVEEKPLQGRRYKNLNPQRTLHQAMTQGKEEFQPW